MSFESLKSGSLVEIELLRVSDNRRLKTIIDTPLADNEFTIFTPVDKGKPLSLHIDEDIKVIFTVETPEGRSDTFSFMAKVTKKMKKNDISIVRLSKGGSPKKMQRRQFFRLDLVKNMKILHEGKVVTLLTKDLSGGGMRGFSATQVPVEADVIVQLPTQTGDILPLHGRVISNGLAPESRTKYDIRITFADLNKSDKEKLVGYIYGKQTEVLKTQMKSKIGEEEADFSGVHFGDYFEEPTAIRFVKLIPLINWFLTLYMITIVVKAKPATINPGGPFARGYIPKFWKLDVLATALPWALVIIAFDVIGLLLKSSNPDPRTKHRVFSYIAQITISVICIVFYFVMLSLTALE